MANLAEKIKALRRIIKNDEDFIEVVNSIEESRKEGELSGVDFKELKNLKLKEDGEIEEPIEVDSDEAAESDEDVDDEIEDVDDEIEDEEPDEEEELEEDEEEEEYVDSKERKTIGSLTFDEFGSVIADVISEVVAPLNESMTALTTAKEKSISENAELKKLVSSQAQSIADLQKTVKELTGETTRAKTGFIASESDDTETDAEKFKENLRQPNPIDEMVNLVLGK